MSTAKEKTSLRTGIQAIAERDALSADELADLHQLAHGAPADPSRRRWLAAAASLGAISAAGYFGLSSLSESSNLQRMAEEVAGKHLQAAPLDLLSDDLEQTREVFAALGFHLLDAAEIEGVPGELLGGRFCSLASIPAAHLRYRDGDRVYTVYQARYDRSHHQGAAAMDRGESGAVRHIGGVEVCICHTQGVVLAIASGGTRAQA